MAERDRRHPWRERLPMTVAAQVAMQGHTRNQTNESDHYSPTLKAGLKVDLNERFPELKY